MENPIQWCRSRTSLILIAVGMTTAMAAFPWRLLAQQPPATQPTAATTAPTATSDVPDPSITVLPGQVVADTADIRSPVLGTVQTVFVIRENP